MSTISANYFSCVLSYLEKRGLSITSSLTALGLTQVAQEHKKDHDESRVSLTQYNALLKYAELSLSDPLLGFHLGQDIRPADFGALGYLIESSENLECAIAALLKYDNLVADIATAEFSYNKKIASIRWTPHVQGSQHLVLRNMTAWVAVIRPLLAQQLAPLKLSLQCDFSPLHAAQLQQWFLCPVEVNAKVNQLDFPLRYLHLPFRSDNAQMHNAMKLLCDKQLDELYPSQSYHHRVLSMMMAKTSLQDCRLPDFAQALNVSLRTLQRKLKAEQSNFADLLDQERQRRAALYLGKYPLGVISGKLGFNQQSAFNHAFYRWHACSPRQYLRRKH
jgi:AraC-like DNA-binding protein